MKLSPCVELLRPYMELFQYNLFVMVELQNTNAPTKNILNIVNNMYFDKIWLQTILFTKVVQLDNAIRAKKGI